MNALGSEVKSLDASEQNPMFSECQAQKLHERGTI